MTVEFDPTKSPYKIPKKPAEQSQEAMEKYKLSPDKLKNILGEHEQWLKSEKFEKWAIAPEDEKRKYAQGRLNLSLYNLQKAELEGADLRYANLQGAMLSSPYLGRSDPNLNFSANLKNAKLIGAQLQGALLRGVNLQKADLHYANMEEADLCHAMLHGANLRTANLSRATLNRVEGLEEAYLKDVNLEGATGLLGEEFAGTDVTGAKLPEKIAKFEGLAETEKISQRAQKLFLSLLLGCVYCWLTIATTMDVALITNSGSSPLPIIQTKIPIAGFYWAAPLILLSLYFWFHLYLQRLWEGLAKLPAVFQDGKELHEKVYPWLISGMVSSHVKLLKEHRPALSRIQTGISIVLVWWLVPFTFLLLWLRYIPRHDWMGTYLHVGVLAVSITAAILLHRLAAKTLRGEKTASLSWKEKLKSLSSSLRASLTLVILGVGLITFFTLSTWAIEGVRPRNSINSCKDLSKSTSELIPYEWHDGRILLPRLFDFFGYRTYANLVEADISTKPPKWSRPEGGIEEIPNVKGAKLKGANLQHAYMVRAFFIKADLRGANLQGADLRGANLQGADLRGANLTDVNNLTQTQLDQACVNSLTKLPKEFTRPNPCPEEELAKQ